MSVAPKRSRPAADAAPAEALAPAPAESASAPPPAPAPAPAPASSSGRFDRRTLLDYAKPGRVEVAQMRDISYMNKGVPTTTGYRAQLLTGQRGARDTVGVVFEIDNTKLIFGADNCAAQHPEATKESQISPFELVLDRAPLEEKLLRLKDLCRSTEQYERAAAVLRKYPELAPRFVAQERATFNINVLLSPENVEAVDQMYREIARRTFEWCQQNRALDSARRILDTFFTPPKGVPMDPVEWAMARRSSQVTRPKEGATNQNSALRVAIEHRLETEVGMMAGEQFERKPLPKFEPTILGVHTRADGHSFTVPRYKHYDRDGRVRLTAQGAEMRGPLSPLHIQVGAQVPKVRVRAATVHWLHSGKWGIKFQTDYIQYKIEAPRRQEIECPTDMEGRPIEIREAFEADEERDLDAVMGIQMAVPTALPPAVGFKRVREAEAPAPPLAELQDQDYAKLLEAFE